MPGRQPESRWGNHVELEIADKVLLTVFVVASVMGATVNKTNFCTMGAVSDWVNMGDTGRLRAWILAMAVAVGGALLMQHLGWVDLDESRVPYRTPVFDWARFVLGGLTFGVGMTLASGCGNKNLIRIGGGNLKSVLVVIVLAVFAYLMTRTDFYGIVFYSWMNPVAFDLSLHGIESQEVSAIIAGLVGSEDIPAFRLAAGGLFTAVCLFIAFKSGELRNNPDNILGGLVIGLAILAGWYITGGPMGQEWIEAAEFADEPPAAVGVQSFTFIAPTADTLSWAMEPANTLLITFGIAALAGVISGSFVYSLITRNFRIEWFKDLADFFRHMIGGALMGIGGVLGLGCTVGQGIAGLSTLALGSFIVVVSIVLGSALTMKIQYYKMLYEEASFAAAFITALADLKLLPNTMRKLEAL